MRSEGYILITDDANTIRIYWNRNGMWGHYYGADWISPFKNISGTNGGAAPAMLLPEAIQRLKKIYRTQKVVAVVSPLDVMERLVRERFLQDLEQFAKRF